MTRVRYTADGGHYRIGGYGFDPGDEKDVDEALADYLADHPDFDVEGGGGGDVDLEDIAPHELTLDELEDVVAEVDDVHVLNSIEMREEQGKDREGAYDLINSRRSDLEEA